MLDAPPHRMRTLRFTLVPLMLAASCLFSACCDKSGGGGGSFPSTIPPNASFSAQPTQGPRPFNVDFANTSTGTITSFLWDFGDGTTSTEQTPQHQYVNTGHFDVRLEATGPDGTSDHTIVDLIQVTSPLQDPSFEAQSDGAPPAPPWLTFFGPNGNVGHLIRSAAGGADLGMPTDAQLWCELGAESTGNTTPPIPGKGGPPPPEGAGITQEFTYPIGQSVLQFSALFINAEGANQAAHNDWVSFDVSDGIESATIYARDTFSAVESTSTLHPGQAATPNEVVTADLAQLFPSSDFTTLFKLTMQVGNGGDGSTPSHAYVDAGRFEPPGAPLQVAFVADQTSVETGIPIHFTDLTSGNPTSWVWDFGDGIASSLENPTHIYAQPGVYDVRLRATAPGVTGDLLIPDYISVFPPAGTLDFHVRVRRATTNHAIAFTNLSSGNFVNWTWDFGDGQTFFQTVQSQAVLHTYATAGLYSIGLSGTFENGSSTSILKPDFVLVQDPPVITSQPQNLTVIVGQTAAFSVTATGTSLNYEWRRNGAVIVGAPNSPNYVTPPTTAANQGDAYTCRVFNFVGTQTSSPAFLHVIT